MVKTPSEIALMRISGKLLASVFEMLDQQDLAGMSTLQVNDLVDPSSPKTSAPAPQAKGSMASNSS